MPEEILVETMRRYAAELVELARDRFQIDLDYSQGSAQQVETMMDAFYQDPAKVRAIGRLGEEARHRENLMDMVDSEEQDRARDWLRREQIGAGQRQLAVMVGAYLGEVIRRKWGGEWRQNGGARLQVLGQDLNPGGLAYFRLTEGDRHNVAEYFDRVVGKLLLAAPGPAEQRAQPSWTQERVEISTPHGPLVLSGLKLEKDAQGRLEISGSVTNAANLAWVDVSFTVHLYDADGAPIPIELDFKKTLRAAKLGKGETKALGDMVGRSPLGLGRFSQEVARFEVALNEEQSRTDALPAG